MSVEKTLREVQISRSRLRYLLTWLEQVTPTVTDSGSLDNAEDDDRNPPSLALANSVLSILQEPLPSEQSCHSGKPVSRVSFHPLNPLRIAIFGGTLTSLEKCKQALPA